MRNITILALISVLAGCGGGASTSAPVNPPLSKPPVISFSADALSDGRTNLSWGAANANSCNLSGDATSSEEVAGTLTVIPAVPNEQSYTITCTGNGGTSSVTKTPKLPNSFSTTCDQTDSATSGNWIGDYFVRNDKGVTPLQPQCQSATVDSSGTIDVITSWDYSSTNRGKVDAGPGFQYGKTEAFLGGDWGQSTVGNFPIKVSNVSSTLGITYTNTISSSSSSSAYDLLFDLYFTDNTSFSDEPLELSINETCVNSCGDTYTSTVVINGVTYNVAYHPATSTSSAHLEFSVDIVATSVPVTSGSTTFKPFIDYAVANGYLKNTQYLGTIFVINEIYAGSATSEINARITE